MHFTKYLHKIILLYTILLSSYFFSLSALQAQNQNISIQDNLPYGYALSHVVGYNSGSAEYAIITAEDAISIVDVSNPNNANEVIYLGGLPNTPFRAADVWGNHAYIVNEASGGLLILDLSPLPASVGVSTWTSGMGPTGMVTLNTASHVFVDENGVLYIFGANSSGGALMLDVNTNPINPPILGEYNTRYAHDGYVKNDILYTAEINDGLVSIVDISNKATPVILGTQSINLAHSMVLSSNSQYLFVSSEQANGFIEALDVSDPTDIQSLGSYQSNPGSNSIPHDLTIKGDFLVIAYYGDGVRLVDASQPQALIEVGYYDTAPSASGTNFAGCWGVDTRLSYVLAADINNGLFVLEPDCINAAFLQGSVINANTNAPIFNASIQLIEDNAGNTTTSLFGSYFTAVREDGLYSVLVTANGFAPQFMDVNLTSGTVENLNIQLTPSVEVAAKVFLEGAYVGSNTMSTIFQSSNNLPISTPYNTAPWNDGSLKTVPSTAWFTTNTVDWVLLEARDASFNVVETQPALLLEDGTVTDIFNLGGGVHFSNLTTGNSYHLTIRHRNHLDIMSASMVNLPNTGSPYDFTTVGNIMGGSQQAANLGGSNYGLRGGDLNGDGIINFEDYNIYRDQLGSSNFYNVSNINFNTSINTTDFDMYQPNAPSIGIWQLRY